MTELVQISVCFGKAGDIVPLNDIDNCFWQFPDYNNDFPENDATRQPQIVDIWGEPLKKQLKLPGDFWASYEKTEEIVTWDNICKDDTYHAYVRLKEDWGGICGFTPIYNYYGYSESKSYTEYELDSIGHDAFKEHGIFEGWQEDIVKMAKDTALDSAKSIFEAKTHKYLKEIPKTNYASILFVVEMHWEPSVDWETGVDEGSMVIDDIFLFDFSKI